MLSPDKIGPAIRSIRESKGYSQEYMAEMLNISQSTYACLESGKTAMRVDRLFQILQILQVDFHSLLDIEKGVTTKVHNPNGPALDPDVRFVYEKMIGEMKEEIDFLRKLVRQQ